MRMDISIEIRSDITPENLEAKVLEHARQCVEEEIRSRHSEHGGKSHGKPSLPGGVYGGADLNDQPRYALLARSLNAARLGFPAGVGSAPDRAFSPTELRARVFLRPGRR